MSRNRRNRGPSSEDTLSHLEGSEMPPAAGELQGMSTTEFASAGYNSQVADFEAVGRGKVTARPIEIDKIVPDARQPRRVIPSVLRQYWDGRPAFESMAYLFTMWMQELTLERGGQLFPLDAILRGEITPRAMTQEIDETDEERPLAVPGRLEAALLNIAELAASLKRDGLMNPISVTAQGGGYIIETGERRWMAYHLLRWRFAAETTWGRIPAREVDGVNIWRQASENNARSALNAIARARQLALLLMDTYQRDYGVTFLPLEQCANELAFYAQVSDGITYKIPPPRMEMFLNAMGLPNPVQLRQYRTLLRLPLEVWALADDLNWTQSAIEKEIMQRSDGEIRTMIQLAQRKAGLLPPPGVSTLTRQVLPHDEAHHREYIPSLPPLVSFKRWMKHFRALRLELDTLDPGERDAILVELEDIVDQFRPRKST
ncbi:MAG: ParB N-terminal domain-containing protein [Anaerolineae bacterium]|jgi:hypothetical protein|nr:ParB N-terminal domain-containing protein [Anaerolineae bacterium]